MRRISWRYIGTIVLLGLTLAVVNSSERRTPQDLLYPLERIPHQILDWAGTADPPLDRNMLAVLRPSSYLSRTYRRGADTIGLFVSYYSQQKAGESMHSPKNCLPGNGWQVWEAGEIAVSVAGDPVRINKYRVQKGSQRMLVLYWYQTQHRIIASEYVGKLCLVWDSIARGHTAGSIVRITIPDTHEALGEATAFAAAAIAEMRICLGAESAEI